MGSGSLFDPINSISAFGLGDYQETTVGDIPPTAYQTGNIAAQAEQDTFSEGEEATIRKNITKKRLGTAQAKIPLADTGVESNPDL